MSGRTVITSAEAPPAVGPYSQGIRAGSFVFLAGQIPLVRDTGKFVEGLIKEVLKRKPKTDSEGVVRCFVGSLGSKQTLVIPMKVNGEQITNLTIRANEALRVSVTRADNKNTLAAIDSKRMDRKIGRDAE